MRSFVIYVLGGIAGLMIISMFGSQPGAGTGVAPFLGFGLATLLEYFVPPAKYQPRDPHRHGESPPVTAR